MPSIWIGATWKMNKTLTEAVEYLEVFSKHVPSYEPLNLFLVLPFTHLTTAKKLLADTGVLLGAQNMHWEDSGEYTGEISPLMLSDIGVELVELGHSERRLYFNEDDYSVNRKVLAAINNKLVPLVCVGEHQIERDFGVANEVVGRQVKIALHNIPEDSSLNILIAYEPVWAIGKKGTAASANEAEDMHSYIRSVVTSILGTEIGMGIPILYGGSVNTTNAADYVNMPNIDGLFMCRAGLDPVNYINLIDSIREAIISIATTERPGPGSHCKSYGLPLLSWNRRSATDRSRKFNQTF
jgi:triosephosphate isomerase